MDLGLLGDLLEGWAPFFLVLGDDWGGFGRPGRRRLPERISWWPPGTSPPGTSWDLAYKIHNPSISLINTPTFKEIFLAGSPPEDYFPLGWISYGTNPPHLKDFFGGLKKF